MNTKWIAILVLVAACGTSTEEPWWEGTEEPSLDSKSDEKPPLTIFLTEAQTSMPAILPVDQLGDFEEWRTGTLPVDGLSIDEDTLLVFQGELHSFDRQTVEQHTLVIDPNYWSKDEGAATDAGFLVADFKDDEFVHVHKQSGARLGATAGVFRGQIIATNDLGLADDLPEKLSSLYVRPTQLGQRPPNLLRNVEIIITPTVVLSSLAPEGGCLGDEVVDNTNAATTLQGQVALAGFPRGDTVDVEVTYSVPHHAAETTIGRAWAWVKDQVSNAGTQEIVKVEAFITDDVTVVDLPSFATVAPALGSNLYTMDVSVNARTTGAAAAFATPYKHQIYVSTPGVQVVVDQFELCPKGDELCRQFRDDGAPDNVIARRTKLEARAAADGLYDVIKRPLGACAGGDRIAGSFSDSCNIYRESDDVELTTKVSTELNFELSVNGEAKGGASWGGVIGGLAAADVGAAFAGAFGIDTALDASFATSRTWARRSSLDVLYDPSNTQIQWWRVVTPRLRYLEVAEFDACGRRPQANEIFLSDLRDSRLVIGCEEVPSFDTTCHAVEPTADAVAACESLLIPTDSPEGEACIAGAR